jgi:hypothetical protein
MHVSRFVSLVSVMVVLAMTAYADDEPDALLAAKLVVVKPGKLAKFLAKGAIPMPSAANDPTVEGATLSLFDTAFSAGAVSYALPAAGWTALGVPAGSKGYKYKGSPGDPCRTVLLKPTLVKAICKGAAVTLAPPFGGEVGVVLTAGSDSKRYCASAGGNEVKNDAGMTKRKDAPAPAACPSSDLGDRVCTLDSTSTLRGFFPFVTAVLDGSVGISCGAVGAGGVAPCSCEMLGIASVLVPAIGDICFEAAGPCPSGEIDCDGGDALAVDLVADHDIGACGSNAGCAAACGAVCSGMGLTYEMRAAGCEGFCQGGSNDDVACTTDSACPGGDCVGSVNIFTAAVHPGRCNCQCGGRGLGAPSAAGTLTCDLGVRLSFESPGDGTCDDPNVIDTGPRCVPLTAAASSGVMLDANGSAGTTVPVGGVETSNGAVVSCAAYAAGSASGLTLVGGLGDFHTSAGGDALSRFSLVCE